jgi:hypothetical protein
LLSQDFEDRHFTGCEISFGTALSAARAIHAMPSCHQSTTRAQKVLCDQANQWTEHCESNSGAQNYPFGKLLIGRARNALQTQLPPAGIKLQRCDQLGLRSFHSVDQQTSQMLAPGRLLELIQDPRVIAAARNPTATPIKGLSAANQIGLVFMLFISSS